MTNLRTFLILQADYDLVFEDDQPVDGISEVPSYSDQPSSGLLSLVHGSLSRIKRSVWSFLKVDTPTSTTVDIKPSFGSESTVLR